MSSDRHNKIRGPTRKLLRKIEISSSLRKELEKPDGLLHVILSDVRSDSSFSSLDGNRTVVWMAPSGEIAELLIQDYTNAEETRVIPFAFGRLEIINEGSEIKIFLITGSS